MAKRKEAPKSAPLTLWCSAGQHNVYTTASAKASALIGDSCPTHVATSLLSARTVARWERKAEPRRETFTPHNGKPSAYQLAKRKARKAKHEADVRAAREAKAAARRNAA